jgi:hypothetical protein
MSWTGPGRNTEENISRARLKSPTTLRTLIVDDGKDLYMKKVPNRCWVCNKAGR